MMTYFLKKTGNKYKRLPYKIGPYKYCEYFDEEMYFIEDLRKKSDFPAKGTCPWPKKKYTINNYEVRTNSSHFNLILIDHFLSRLSSIIFRK